MKDLKKWLAKIVSENDQDESDCDVWWMQSTTNDKKLVWEFLQQDFKDDQMMEIVSRLAALAFCQAATRNADKILN